MGQNSSAALSSKTRLSPLFLKVWVPLSLAALLLWLLYFAAVLHFLPKGFADIYPGGTASGSAFEDLWVYDRRFTLWRTAAFFTYQAKYFSTFAYPPPCALIYAFLYKLPRLTLTYVLVSLAWGGLIFAGAWRALARRMGGWQRSSALAFSFLLFCFPYTFVVQRGNIEIFLWILVVIGAAAYLLKRPYTAAVMFGLAASMKLYPVLLLALFLRRRLHIGPLFCGVVVAALSTLLALWLTGPTIPVAAVGFFHGVVGFQNAYVNTLRPEENRFDHSSFSLLKGLGLHFHVALATLTRPYYAVAGTTATLLYVLRVRLMAFSARFTFLTTAMVLLPPISYAYTLVHLLLPLLMLVLAQLSENRTLRASWRGPMTIACLLIIMLPTNLFRTRTLFFSGQLQSALLLLILLVVASMPTEAADEAEERSLTRGSHETQLA